MKEPFMDRTITASAVASLIAAHKETTILDVRRKADYEADPGVIPGARRLDPDAVDEWGKDLPKDKPVIVYCARGGSVSNKVLDRLLDRKVAAQYIEGGIAAWKAAGNRIEQK
jgi:rhodanese-related sulfurtransferase